MDGAFPRPFLQAGLALLANGSWAVVLVPATAALIRVRVIEREERYLERAFGEEYLRYEAGVRRWV